MSRQLGILLTIFISIALGFTHYTSYRIGHSMGVVSIKESAKPVVLTDTQKADRLFGYREGVLAMANYDRRTKDLPPYQTWQEFDEALKKEQELNKEVMDIIKKELVRRENEKKLKPWLKEKK